jgi:hypothetical protein
MFHPPVRVLPKPTPPAGIDLHLVPLSFRERAGVRVGFGVYPIPTLILPLKGRKHGR